ncbi:hypothetical protein WA026_004786 [Henosepilachna vigintioctopunctata]|uniref:Protein kinase domain-containing protein n=1 Tax=Henosepilachna vigintioctopunctata TaxID=420089 RepID=A0AAW1V8W9_9CUCU
MKRLRDLAVPKHTITFDEVLEDGIFGQSFRGYYRGQKTVTIKATKDSASQRHVNLFLAEGTMLFGMDHKNVLSVLGVNTENPQQPLIIYPYISRGNLKR